ncbi:MAG: glycine zipper domain-containing protein [Desulfobulbaceae bacterium]|nr:glycine zipper domain-containing protein [Desulfobulbaceae bacterium]
MKKIIVLASLIFLCATSNAGADNSSAGAVAGAAGGAVVGQAIGRNTEGTLVGAVIGGVVGYIVGNEMDRGGYVRQGYSGGSVWVQQPGPVYREVVMTPRPVNVVVPYRPVSVVVPYYRPYYPPANVVIVSEPGRHHGPQRWSGGHKAYKDHGRHWR